MASSTAGTRILVVDDEERIRAILSAVLKDESYTVQTASDGAEAVKRYDEFKPSVVILDLQMPHMDGLDTFRRIRASDPKAVAIILTAHGTIQSAVQAIKEGVYDYLTKPFDNEQLLLVVKRAADLRHLTGEVDQLKQELQKKYSVQSILGESPVMNQVREQIGRIAQTDATVLIEGESGTGKELVGRAIHYESKRRNGPLVIVDCGAIPSNLVESEFFGHEKGAFTDAREQRAGKFEEADLGSIFLDEIGDLPADSQIKLLRVLQDMKSNLLDLRDFDFLGLAHPAEIPRYDPAVGLESYVRSMTERVEREQILEALREFSWNRTEAAKKLKISRKTLFNKMQQYGIKEKNGW